MSDSDSTPIEEQTWHFSLRARWVLSAAALLLVALPIVFRLPQGTQLLVVLQDFAHGPVFAGVAWVVILLLKRHGEPKRIRYRKYWAALAIAVLLGCAVELVQSMTGRDGSLHDIINNTVGAVLGLSIASLFDQRMAHRFHRRGVSLATAVVAAGILVYPVLDTAVGYLHRARRMPELLVPERPVDLRFIRPGSSWLTPTYLPSRWSDGVPWPTLEVLFKEAQYSGFNLFEPYPDWHGYETLALDVTNPNSIELKLTLRIHDTAHDHDYYDRFNMSFVVEPETRTVIRVPLEDIRNGPKRRQLDLSEVAAVGMFTTQGRDVAGGMIYVTRIWLE